MTRQWLEKELEDWIVGNFDSFAESAGIHPATLLGSQIPVAGGRLDVLGFSEHSSTVYVIECKAVRAGERELGQVLRYKDAIDYTFDIYRHVSKETFWNIWKHFNWTVIPVLVAPSL